MSSQAQIPNPDDDVKRPLFTYTPSIWGDYFLSFAAMEVDSKLEQHVQEMKGKVERMLKESVKNPREQLYLVDDIQRLGVSYHFENEIDECLQEIHRNSDAVESDDEDLYITSLRFRLLRQQGYNVSCETFNKFKEGDGLKFKESLLSDVWGLVSLYEASHLRVHGEDILEEALAFTTTHLESMKHQLSPSLSNQVSHFLNQPLRKGIPRVEARYYLSIYHERNSHNETLLTFAKLDFNLLQQLHQKELGQLTRWWKDLDVNNKFSYARDRITEVYFIWAWAVLFEPEYSIARMTLCKIAAVVSIIDDSYDSYGTLEELELFTRAIDRWDISVMEKLPNTYMELYKALMDVYTEIEEEIAKNGKLHRIHYAKQAMRSHVKIYLREAKWFHERHIPTMDEYMALALMSTGYPSLIATLFVLMGDIATQDSFDWLATYPPAVKGASLVCRLMDDIADHNFEKKRGCITSAVECFMKEYGVTDEEAVFQLRRLMSDGWKDINESFFLPDPVPRQLLTRIVNLTCTMEVNYKYEDSYTAYASETTLDDGTTTPRAGGTLINEFIVSTLVQPVPI